MVNEIFGPTFQGEGPSLGQRAGFVRLGRCDLSCRWCDTPYTWDWKGITGTAYDPAKELHTIEIGDVVDRVEAMDVPLVVITGGEPLLQRKGVSELADRLMAAGHDIEIETNGRHRPLDTPGIRYNVSPKLSSSGDTEEDRLRPDVLRELAAAESIFKFVCGDVSDLDEVDDIVLRADLPAAKVWISPLGTTTGDVVAATAKVADETLARGWNLSSRLHILAWGDERGR